MLTWMSSFGKVSLVGIECSGTYGLGLLRCMQTSRIDVLEVTAPDKSDRRRRGKDGTSDAENTAHAAFIRLRTETPKTRDGMVESLRFLKSCRKNAVALRSVALQMIRTSIVSTPDELRNILRHMTRINLVLTLA
jgi:transposase